MTIRFVTLSKIATLTTLLCAVGCMGTAPEKSGDTQNNVTGAACAAEEEDGAADKVLCSIDTDCDSDEVCMDGKCTGMDGEADDGDACDGENEAEDDADEAAGTEEADDADEATDTEEEEDEGGADKINCATDADCDSDEVCSNGKCE